MVRAWMLVFLLAGQAAWAQGFNGTFADRQNGVTVALQLGADGSLQGSLTGPNGQFMIQGKAQQTAAYGVVESRQGPLGFQAQLAPDGSAMQMAFYVMDASGNAVGQGQQLMLQRVAGGAAGQAGAPAAWPPPPPGAVATTMPPGQVPPGQVQPGSGAARPDAWSTSDAGAGAAWSGSTRSNAWSTSDAGAGAAGTGSAGSDARATPDA